jgi:kumamolisin
MADRKLFANSVVSLPSAVSPTPHGLMVAAASPEHRKEMMTILFSLAIPDDAKQQLKQAVAQGTVISPKDLAKKYAADAGDAKALVAWLKSEGFKIEKISADRTSIYARGTVDQIQKSLAVNMVRVTKEGVTYTAAQDAPSLPASVGKSVSAIIGLQPFRHAQKQLRMYLPQDPAPAGKMQRAASSRQTKAGRTKAISRRAKAASKGAVAGFNTNVQNGPPYLVAEILKAYGADRLPVTGKGQTIAILIDRFPNDTDLKAFLRANGLSTTITRVQKINVTGVNLPPPDGEETMDAEWSSGVAPGAKIRIYASGTLRFVDLDRALDRIISDLAGEPGMRQLSISLGLGETFMAPDEVTTQSGKFLRLAAAGVNVFISSGDAGSNPDGTGHSSSGPTQAEYESSDENVIGVGGTSLDLDANGAVISETAWVGSGGGKSVFFNRPAWQTGPGVPAGTERLVPDVSAVGDPNTGALVILQGQSLTFAGTSLSAPIWAGFCALINEARTKAGKPALPFLNPLIYPLIGSANFRDVASGNNGAFQAGPGYDMVTGIGAPNVEQLIASLTS